MSPYNQNQVIYLVCSPFDMRDFKRFGISNWINRNWNVKIFDVTQFLNPKLWAYSEGEKISANFKGLKFFQNIDEVLTALKHLHGNVIFIDLLGYSRVEQRIRNTASLYGKIVKLKLGIFYIAKTKFRFFKLFILLIINPIDFIKKLIFNILNIIKIVKDELSFPDYLVVGGLKSISYIKNKKTSVIKAHNLDYDLFLKKKKIRPNNKKSFLVFLDEDGPYHPNFVQLGLKPFVKAQNYYPVIDNGLERLANSLNLNVKIAAHPRSNYKIRNIKFKYNIIENKTYELIRDASLVVCHASTSIQWAVIMKKPIIFATTNEIENKFYARSYANIIKDFASELGKKVLNFSNISSIKNFSEYLIVDNNKYNEYIQNFIKTKGSPEKFAWDIIIERIENDLFIK